MKKLIQMAEILIGEHVGELVRLETLDVDNMPKEDVLLFVREVYHHKTQIELLRRSIENMEYILDCKNLKSVKP